MQVDKNIITIFTDGSCNPQYKIGSWAAIVFVKDKKYIITGIELNTTHNRMELLAAIKSIEYIKNNSMDFDIIRIHSDSQYLINLFDRSKKLKDSNFLTGKGNTIRNDDLVKKILEFFDMIKIEFTKEKAHGKNKSFDNYNREVDILSRSIVRQYIKNNFNN